MDRRSFRQDPYLRSSAYHLVTWSLAGLVLELRVDRAHFDASSAALVGVLLGAAVLTSITNERRVGKIAGPAGAPVWAGAWAMWLRLLGTLGMASGLLVYASRPELLFGIWTFGVGWGLAVWGWKTRFAWYAGLGLGLAWVGFLDAAMLAAGTELPALRALVLGAVVPGLALLTNRRYLWFGPDESSSG